ncbi:hypothetical protein EN828_10460 [Mesorhizobium sp. M2D.F.Ca.ET.185.01.1.1]|uniref:hypothetical protein n=1 Tax=unclassified Mesorhizobium TaxID=325217 RepID=UPI000FCBAF17|nr:MULTISPECIES: hypothetical protein [unclassified Mesorhizobium]TGT97807.1 hypothetical protein EN806_48370 [bacterium M00.F.Ca.ET.163.01.1.1]TGP26092.1 hypothetical protein EN875_034270 [Mesorhizobium sp. M2D.F.Ca.ET.232.01.1.1]TGQ24065.1 hypothetical protein EN863_063865 [Mesorhizobium sp. M00.F.Ca.ET.220.01.1.1]TGQ89458.1 hypothetical protein EN849_09960 [Mesorhizobium sp. M2D.F.Ca.ET.206.01.1.1]TGS32623.1 hypothetical protein EN828_10460 [Mesorhizobium sp. M2D.F.Ca.ET.185.01.1.1]
MIIVNASEWPLERLAPYMSDVLCEMGRLARRFPGDVTMGALYSEFLSGKKTLWLVLEGDKFVSMAMSTIRTVDATGQRIATLCDLAGRDVHKYAAELCAAVEAWASQQNCGVFAVEGREGWKPLLAQHGYKPFAVLYRKRVEAHGNVH